jgi:hypothetical protein
MSGVSVIMMGCSKGSTWRTFFEESELGFGGGEVGGKEVGGGRMERG